MTRITLIVALAVTLVASPIVLVGCGGGSGESTETAQTASTPQPAAGASPPGSGRRVDSVTLPPMDEATIAKGKAIFDSKCAVCHKIEERYVGPALAGVTERRKPEWIVNMILDPDRMIKEDPDAKALFVQFLTPMTNQNVAEEDALAILTYFRSVDAGAKEQTTP